MSAIVKNLSELKKQISNEVTLIAVSKTHPVEKIKEAYAFGQRHFGENKVQELTAKQPQLPADINWHLIGHLQTNKVKYIAPFVSLIHSVDSFKLLQEINKQAQKCNRIINCLLQIYIADEETKFGLSFEEATLLLKSEELKQLTNIRVVGLMGMATNTDDDEQIRKEFKTLKRYYDQAVKIYPSLTILSMGMSSDYMLAIEEGSTMIRVGSKIFGERDYTH